MVSPKLDGYVDMSMARAVLRKIKGTLTTDRNCWVFQCL